MTPYYCNEVEICASRAIKEDVIVLRFYYKEPKIQEGKPNNLKRPYPMVFPGPAVCMSRARMKDMFKKFLTWMAEEDEGRNPKKEGDKK